METGPVTGAGKNVGKAIARELAARGADILLNYFHSHEAARETKLELEAAGAKVDLLRASVALERQVERTSTRSAKNTAISIFSSTTPPTGHWYHSKKLPKNFWTRPEHKLQRQPAGRARRRR